MPPKSRRPEYAGDGESGSASCRVVELMPSHPSRVRSVDLDQLPAEPHRNPPGAGGSGKRPVELAAADHLQVRAEPRDITTPIDRRNGPAPPVLELEAVACHADRFDGPVDVKLGEHVHAVRRQAQEQSFVERVVRSPLADDRFDAHPLKKHAEHWSGDATAYDRHPIDLPSCHGASLDLDVLHHSVAPADKSPQVNDSDTIIHQK
jgi:hypothetical protein